MLSKKAVMSFVTAEPLPWNGTPKILFARNQTLQFKVRLDVAEPAPKTPLPKAIIRFVFKTGTDQAVAYERTFKQKEIPANSDLTFSFAANELARLPANKPINVIVEIRWRTSSGNEHKAFGSTEIILINKYFLKEQGSALAAEQELTDMKRFRPFWNKIWESPALSTANGNNHRKYMWELDVNAKYSMLLSPTAESNGLMQTKLQQESADPDSPTARTEGRMKAGMELSINELNKLMPLWPGSAPLDREHVEALQTDAFARNNGGEFIYHFKLKGKAAERGMIWVVPVFKLFNVMLGTAQKTDETGQVTAIADETIHFPLPVSARIMGLKSQS
jgi:hypothetical protein